MAIVTVTAFNLAIVGRDDLNNVILVYLFAIAAVSVVLGYQPALVAATTSVVAFDYFFLVPYHSLMIANGRNVLTFAGMFVTAVFVSSLYERLREKARMARENEQRVETLYGLARALVDAATVDEVCERAVTQIEEGGLGSATIRVQVKDRLGQAICSPGAEASQGDDFAIAEWTAAHLEPAGAGAKHFPTAEARYVPLLAGRGCVGVLALRLSEAAIVTGASDGGVSLLDSMARQVAVAVDRALLAEEKERALIDAEMERIHNAVLSSISHDLRAPLGVIGAASSALVEGGLRLQGTTRSEMAQIIKDEAIRLNELLRSLFEVTRLQSGGFSVRRADQHRSRRTLRANVPSALPLVHLDAVLIEQVMLNLLDNAFKHSKSQQPVELDFAMRDSNVVVSVIDHGQGVRDEVLNRIFDKFYRSDRTSGAGLGLGLTIARGIVEAHGGRMWACHTRGGGLTVQFTLPVGEPAPGAPSVELPELASA
jgi:two-component system sensor histidine kinase KdpD